MGGIARILVALAAVAAVTAGEAAGDSTPLPATRDAKISFDQAELLDNYGQAAHLRVRQLAGNSAEVSLIDFDRGAITSFVKAHRGKQISAKLRLWYGSCGGGANATLEAMALDSAVDWTEGQENGTNAAKGECCATAAQFGTSPWQRADGKAATDLREVIYDKGFDHLNGLADTAKLPLDNTATNRQVELDIDLKLLEHLALDPKCRGLVLFTRDKAFLDFSSREQSGKPPELVLTAAK